MTLAVVIGGALAYICVGGFAWAVMPARWDEPSGPNINDGLPVRGFLTIFWPGTLVGYAVYRIALIGPRTVRRLRERSADRKLARARVVRS